MIQESAQFLSGVSLHAPAGWVSEWLLRGSLFFALLILLALPIARGRSSSVRHLLLVSGFVVALVLPFVSLALPRWEVLPPSALPSLDLAAGDLRGSASGGEVLGDMTGSGTDFRSGSRDVAEVGADAEVGERSEGGVSASSGDGLSRVGGVSDAGSESPTSGWGRAISPRTLFLVWIGGFLVLTFRLTVSLVRASRLVREGSEEVPASWRGVLFDLSDRLGLRSAPRLIVSEDVALPMTCGLLNPAVLLPAAALGWTQDRVEAVLCHELAHVRRRDLLSNVLGYLGNAVYWVNPFSWWAARRMRTACEQACDDLVLSMGYRPSEYAEHLLQIATLGHRGRAPVTALPMARPGEFESRLLSILSPRGERGRPGLPSIAGVTVGVLALALPVAVLAPVQVLGAPAAPQVVAAPMDAEVPTPARVMSEEVDSSPAPYTVVVPVSDAGVGQLEREYEGEVHPGLDLSSLGAFVAEVTNFAGRVASDAVSAALTEVTLDLVVGSEGSSQEGLQGTFERTLSLTGPLEIDLATGSGGIEIREGDVNRVTIQGTVRVGTRRRGREGAEAVLRQILASPPLVQNGNRVEVGKNMDRTLQEDVSISYEVVVPVATSARAVTGSGSVSIRGVNGSVDASTGSGGVTLTAIGGGVRARTGSGSIRAERVSGPFEGETGSGSINASLLGTGDVFLRTGSGSVQISGVVGALRIETGSGRITAGGEMRGGWHLESGSGGISVDLPSSASFSLVARTGSGGVEVNHPVTIQGQIATRRQEITGMVRGGGPELNIRTGSGSITVD